MDTRARGLFGLETFVQTAPIGAVLLLSPKKHSNRLAIYPYLDNDCNCKSMKIIDFFEFCISLSRAKDNEISGFEDRSAR